MRLVTSIVELSPRIMQARLTSHWPDLLWSRRRRDFDVNRKLLSLADLAWWSGYIEEGIHACVGLNCHVLVPLCDTNSTPSNPICVCGSISSSSCLSASQACLTIMLLLDWWLNIRSHEIREQGEREKGRWCLTDVSKCSIYCPKLSSERANPQPSVCVL